MNLKWIQGRHLVIGSLFTGYGGLDQGVERALLAAGARSVRVAWVADINPGASRILAHRYPDAPNLGDITAVDWTAVERVDIVTGGFPCQDVSHAGKRAGLRPDTRSGLWAQMAYATSILRPRLVVAENVRGLLSAPAHSDVEPCPWCLGDDGRESALRALGAVLGDLADIGYDAQWVGLRASDVGAPHGRFRVFITAHPADTDDERHARGDGATGRRGPGSTHRSVTDRDADGTRPGEVAPVRPRVGAHAEPCGVGRDAATDPDSATRGERGVAAPGQEEGGWARADACGRGRAPVADTDVTGPQGPEPTAGHDVPARGAAPYATGNGRHERRPQPARIEREPDAPDTDSDGQCSVRGLDTIGCDVDRCDGPDTSGHPDEPASRWGTYGPAVDRWAAVLRRPAPDPTETSPKGGQRLSPRFVEWMMGLPDGWVTDLDLSRNDMLRALGNGVVPQQAAAAVRALLEVPS